MGRYILVLHKETHDDHPDWEFTKSSIFDDLLDRMIDEVDGVCLWEPTEEWDTRDNIYRPSCMKKAYEFLKRMDSEDDGFCQLEQLLDLLSKEPDYGISNSY